MRERPNSIRRSIPFSRSPLGSQPRWTFRRVLAAAAFFVFVNWVVYSEVVLGLVPSRAQWLAIVGVLLVSVLFLAIVVRRVLREVGNDVRKN